MSVSKLIVLAVSLGLVVWWAVMLRRELRKEYALGRERGQRSLNLVLMGASATVWVFLFLIATGLDLTWAG